MIPFQFLRQILLLDCARVEDNTKTLTTIIFGGEFLTHWVIWSNHKYNLINMTDRTVSSKLIKVSWNNKHWAFYFYSFAWIEDTGIISAEVLNLVNILADDAHVNCWLTSVMAFSNEDFLSYFVNKQL